jgi:RNA polymerase sigma-70 factor (ECF subfamily)
MEYSQQRWDLLAARLRAGDRDAAAELVDSYYQQIYLYMRRLGHNRQTSEDLTQETFFQAWQHIGQLRSSVALNCWLYRIASNVSRHHWRRHSGKDAVSLDETKGIDVRDNSIASEDEVKNAEQIQKLRLIIEALPIKLKQAAILHYMQYLTIAEAAEAADVREGTLKSRLNRAIKIIRNQLTEK